jgi:hypothetical protein
MTADRGCPNVDAGLTVSGGMPAIGVRTSCEALESLRPAEARRIALASAIATGPVSTSRTVRSPWRGVRAQRIVACRDAP